MFMIFLSILLDDYSDNILYVLFVFTSSINLLEQSFIIERSKDFIFGLLFLSLHKRIRHTFDRGGKIDEFSKFPSKMEDFKLKFILLYFQICGFCHFRSLEKYPTKRLVWLMFVLSCIHLIILSSIVSVTFFYADHIFLSNGMLSLYADILQSMLPLISQYVMIIESLLKFKIKDRFWARIRYIDLLLLGTTNQLKRKANNKYFIKCVALLVTLTSIDVFVYFHIKSDQLWCNHFLLSYYTFVICRSTVLFCVLFIDTLKFRIIMLNKRLKEVQNGAKNQINLMKCCKRAYEMIWLCVQDINHSFGMKFRLVNFYNRT